VDLKPFTLEDAMEIREDFEDLIDTEFNLEPSLLYVIQDIAICPFNESDRLAFFTVYAKDSDTTATLKSYSGTEYEVVLVCVDADDETKLLHLPIRAFAAEKGIQYNFPS
jgi:hypothetical protein